MAAPKRRVHQLGPSLCTNRPQTFHKSLPPNFLQKFGPRYSGQM
ncbi:hypothetical protein PSJ8397_00932 [Pseudooctadecabacter jejudonensis]|uniref:Uncharacterized protein n=1 Tax=Pseudooctadecabacter jejudonensis TaxID=1391910 RepID=A0A1Y5RQ08_9RHOB|nr:hypothetical protein PSJ8397_00932 [Pseudooctadecabacter jejudonensis]